VTSLLRRSVPSLARFFERPTCTRDEALFVVLWSVALTWLAVRPSGVGSGAAWALLSLTAAQIALFTWGLATLLRVLTARRLGSSAYALAASLVTAYLVLDRIAFAILHAHPAFEVARETYEAFRAGALAVGTRGVFTLVLGILGGWLALTVALKALAHLPPTPRADGFVRRAAVPGLLAVGTASTVRACVFGDATSAQEIQRAVPWDTAPATASRGASGADGGDRMATLLGEDRVFALLEARGSAMLARPVRARSRPDILIVHVESLRSDMLRADVAPSMVALAKESLVPRHHLTTGTNTGTGVFGILEGLLSPYYPLARRDHFQPLPLRLLKALGYRVSVYFANNFRVYDGLYDLFFGGLADFTYTGPGEPVFAADGQMVDAYLASIRNAPPDAPRFDYVILDSTHYDYSYPPAFEKFTPAMTLDLGFRDGIIVREGINDELKPRAAFVKNRYQNSVLYADSLVQEIVDTLRQTQRLERTIVVVTGDHGEEFWEHGAFGHGYGRLSREQCEVPLVMRIPGAAQSTRYAYASHADIFPTVFDAMGLEIDGGAFMNGKSLLRYEPSLDFAVAGFGVTGQQVDHRLVVEGDGLAVHWVDVPPFEVTDVTGEDGSPLAAPPQGRVDDLVFRAIGAKGLR
jgi:hypothetical protein